MTQNLKDLIAQLTLEEKASLCVGDSNWTTPSVPRLNIPAMRVADGPHGVRRTVGSGSGEETLPATCFPTASLLASTWDPDLIRRVGEALAEECLALGVDVLLGPGVNMKRSPLCGRNFEYFSEDPFLAGEIASAWIEGVQSRGVGTSLKHFAANNQEFQRFSIDAQINERPLREIYLAAFEKAVKTAHPWTVMHAYNKVNGKLMSENDDLLRHILKEEWGFEGLVVSDWGAVRDRVKSLLAGTDLEMPGPKPRRVRALVDAVRSGALAEAALDEAVERIIRVVFKAAATPKGGMSFDDLAHHRLAAEVAAQGMVLLKNDGLLPLGGQKSLAVIGRAAQEAHFQGGGSSHILPTHVSIPLEALQARCPGAQLRYAEGYPADDSSHPDLIAEAAAIAATADAALLFIALPDWKESESYDRTDLDLTAQQVALIQAVCAAQPRSVVILNNGSSVAMGEWLDQAAAVLEAWMMGQAGAEAVADILFGVVNPSGRLSETFPLGLEDTPAYLSWPGELGRASYDEGLYIGYRWYDARRMAVRFPFGFGLSYTQFTYSNARASKTSFNEGEGLTVFVDVTNTGSLAGCEVVQLYVHDAEASLHRPEKELKGFAKIKLQPGETQTVAIALDWRAFTFWHPTYQDWVGEDGEFELLIGASSADIRQRLSVTLENCHLRPSLLNEESTVREWLADPRGADIFAEFFAALQGEALANMGGDEEGQGMGMNMLDLLMDMRVLSALHFVEDGLPDTPENVIASLLARVQAA